MRQDGSNDRRQGQTWEQLVAAEPRLASLLEEVRAARPRSASEPIMPPCIGDSFVRSLELREMTCPLPAWLDRERPRPLASVVRVRDGVSKTGGALGSQSTGDTLFTGGYRLYRIVPDSASTAEGSTRHKVIRGVTWRPDALCTFVTIDSLTVTSYGVCHVLITSWAEMP